MVAQRQGSKAKQMRDAALLTLGWSGALGRSELVALDHADVRFEREGVIVTLRRSKSSQENAVDVAVPYASTPALCPVRALREWIDFAGIKDGPLFRSVDIRGQIGAQRLSDRAVALIVQDLARRVGVKGDFAGHSLRRGFITTAARAGKSERAIKRHSRHKSPQVMRGYIEQATQWDDHAGIGLL